MGFFANRIGGSKPAVPGGGKSAESMLAMRALKPASRPLFLAKLYRSSAPQAVELIKQLPQKEQLKAAAAILQENPWKRKSGCALDGRLFMKVIKELRLNFDQRMALIEIILGKDFTGRIDGKEAAIDKSFVKTYLAGVKRTINKNKSLLEDSVSRQKAGEEFRRHFSGRIKASITRLTEEYQEITYQLIALKYTAAEVSENLKEALPDLYASIERERKGEKEIIRINKVAGEKGFTVKTARAVLMAADKANWEKIVRIILSVTAPEEKEKMLEMITREIGSQNLDILVDLLAGKETTPVLEFGIPQS